VIIQQQAEALRALGHRIEFVHVGETGGPLRYVLARRWVRAALPRVGPHVVHAHFGYSGLAIPRVPVPIVCTFYGDDLNGTATTSGPVTWKSRLGIAVSQYVACRSARCIAVSESLRARLWTSGLRAKATVIRDAVDPTLFRPLPRETARARLGVSPDEVLVIFPHAADVATKRVWLAEAAVSELRRSIPTARLWIVNGRPPTDMPWYYGAADAMIVTSALEGGPSSVKEALACGLPVVSVAVGDTQLFADAPTAMVRAGPEPASLAAALLEVLRRPQHERRNHLPPELSLDAAARAITNVYRSAIAEFVKPASRSE
jgi:glycosyltransferase involved in cell wall biosynthesis